MQWSLTTRTFTNTHTLSYHSFVSLPSTEVNTTEKILSRLETAENFWHDDRAARACGCQHAGSWHAIKKNTSRNGHLVHTLLRTLRLLMPQFQPVRESMHSRGRAGIRAGEDEFMHAGGKAGAGALEMSPLVPAEALLPDSLGFSAVMRLASTSTGWTERHAGLNVHVWPPNATRRSPSAYTFNTFPTWPSTYEKKPIK